MTFYVAETRSALAVWPDLDRWLASAGTAAVALVPMALFGIFGGWIRFDPVPDWTLPLLGAIGLFAVLVVLAELVFRGLLLSWLVARAPRWGGWLATFAFAAYYPVLALLTGWPEAAVFLQLSYMFATVILGIILTHIRVVSRSLWPGVAIHGFLVLIWLLVFGGPNLT